MNIKRRKTIQLFLVLMLATLTPILTHAQVNIEKLRANQANSNTPTHEIDLSGSFYSGNTESLHYKVKTKSVFQFNQTQVFGVLSMQEKQNQTKKYVSKGFGHLRLITPLTTTFSTDLFTQKQFNEFKLLKDRTLFGAGLRAGITKSDRYNITIGAGAMFETEQHNIDSETKQTKSFRSTNFINITINTSETLSLTTTTYIQPKLTDLKNIRLLMENEIKVKLTQHLNLKTNLNLSHSTKPKQSVKASDIELFTGLSIKL